VTDFRGIFSPIKANFAPLAGGTQAKFNEEWRKKSPKRRCGRDFEQTLRNIKLKMGLRQEDRKPNMFSVKNL